MRILLFCVLLMSAQFVIGQLVSKPIVEFAGYQQSSEVLIDVRTPVEFEEGAIEGAVNIDWFSHDFNQQVQSIDKNKIIYVYCKKGGRSLKAQARLEELGFKNVINLEGGYDAYLQEE
ncbi:rhodanese-like domain-containing protein [Maribacter sp. M208]|uniref:rhodanese-like domain-containing protein n=1 Tax=Maribacter huludaoensis TaxID=3030010 RepID=UPI0023ED6D39|nr:rhodanese-like domain-containing protein [Maribacter huludaoensis]MDF4221354.1 rhodanese-like domain-containing protein [Maribacter huludaoensis]